MPPAAKGKTSSKRGRSLKGCWTCKRRRVRCDEGHPTCRRCHSGNLICEGYEIRLRWGVGIASRGKYTGAEKPVEESIPPRTKRRWDMRGHGQRSPSVVPRTPPIVASKLPLADLKQLQSRPEGVTANIWESPQKHVFPKQDPILNKHFEILASLKATAGTGLNAYVVDRQGLDTSGQGDSH